MISKDQNIPVKRNLSLHLLPSQQKGSRVSTRHNAIVFEQPLYNEGMAFDKPFAMEDTDAFFFEQNFLLRDEMSNNNFTRTSARRLTQSIVNISKSLEESVYLSINEGHSLEGGKHLTVLSPNL